MLRCNICQSNGLLETNHSQPLIWHHALRAVSTGSIRAQETNKDQIEELPAPSRIPNTNDSPAVVLSTTETTLDVKVVGQPRVKQLYLGCISDNTQHTSYNYTKLHNCKLKNHNINKIRSFQHLHMCWKVGANKPALLSGRWSFVCSRAAAIPKWWLAGSWWAAWRVPRQQLVLRSKQVLSASLTVIINP